jgi:hypothetical protein
MTLSLVAKIASHYVPIAGIAGNATLDVGVSIDEEGKVCVLDIAQRKVVHMFSIESEGKCGQIVRVFDSGRIAIASNSIGKMPGHGEIVFYDLCGRFKGSVTLPGSIDELEAVHTPDYCEYLAVTTSKKVIFVLDSLTLDVVKKSSDILSSHFVTYAGGRTLMVVRERASGESIVPLEF